MAIERCLAKLNEVQNTAAALKERLLQGANGQTRAYHHALQIYSRTLQEAEAEQQRQTELIEALLAAFVPGALGWATELALKRIRWRIEVERVSSPASAVNRIDNGGAYVAQNSRFLNTARASLASGNSRSRRRGSAIPQNRSPSPSLVASAQRSQTVPFAAMRPVVQGVDMGIEPALEKLTGLLTDVAADRWQARLRVESANLSAPSDPLVLYTYLSDNISRWYEAVCEGFAALSRVLQDYVQGRFDEDSFCNNLGSWWQSVARTPTTVDEQRLARRSEISLWADYLIDAASARRHVPIPVGRRLRDLGVLRRAGVELLSGIGGRGLYTTNPMTQRWRFNERSLSPILAAIALCGP